MKNYLIIYQKGNGELIKRYRSTMLDYKVGDITSMGWKVLEIKHLWGNKYCTNEEYAKKISEYRLKSQPTSKRFVRFLRRCLYTLENKL